MPDSVETVLPVKSTSTTTSWIVLTDALSNQASSRNCSLEESAIRALESLVRSIGRYGSLCMTVMEDLLPFSRKDWTAPIVALPLYIIFQLAYDSVERGSSTGNLPSHDENILTPFYRALNKWGSSTIFDLPFLAMDEYSSIFLTYLK